ncbi:hypothetical protein ACFY2R_21305 [Micromonospora olivasterospora]|uniref:hypothetical protein n=1 Tax=Micromonospora olivasterospora TaxID=1880 RepID=UPI001B884782|nr:hypothetical protein [Micromonospora olivasterospora]
MDATLAAPRTPVDAAAECLRTAARDRIPCPPLRGLIDPDDVATAPSPPPRPAVPYAVQERLSELRLVDGARVVGRKIGLTSPAVQAQLGVAVRRAASGPSRPGG